MEAKLVSVIVSLNQMHLAYTDVVAAVVVLGDVADITDIVWLHKVPLKL